MRDGWRQVTLGDVAAPSTAQVSAAGSALPYIGLEHFDPGSPTIVRLGKADAMESSAVVVQPGDVLFSKLRPYLNKVAVAEFRAVASTEVLVYRPREGVDLRPDYLALLLRDQRAIQYAVDRSAGSRMPRTSGKIMSAFEVALPPLGEQRRMVDLIAAVDEAIDAADGEAKASVGALAAALDKHLSMDGDFRALSELALEPRGLIGGPFGSSLVSADYRDGGVPVIRGVNMPRAGARDVGGDFVFVTREKAAALSRNQAVAGDVIFTQRGTIGQVGIIPDEAYEAYVVSQSQMRLRVDTSLSTPEYVRMVFTAPSMVASLKSQDRATANPHINLGVLAATCIPVPSLEVQASLVAIWRSWERAASAARTTADALRALRSNLLTVLLSGEHEIPASYDRFLEEAAA